MFYLSSKLSYIIPITKSKNMTNVQEIFNKIKEKQKEQKTIRQIYKDVLNNSKEYQEIIKELDELKIKKKRVEAVLKSDLKSEMDKLESIALDIESNKELLSQASLSKIIKGEAISLEDENSNKYEPIFNVSFKKI